MIRDEMHRLAKLILKREYDLEYDNLIFHRSNLGAGQIANYIRYRWDVQIRSGSPSSYPLGLQLEPTTYCQLHCPFCPRAQAIGTIGPGHMPWDNYENLIRELGPRIFTILFWQWGEPLLHPRIADMIRLAHNYGILTILSTNGQVEITSTCMESLIRSGLDMIIISMDGSSQPVYEKFRKGGSIDRLTAFTRTLIRAKNELGSTTPLINIRTIATSENEEEIDRIRSFTQDAGADLFSVRSLILNDDADPANPLLPGDIGLRSFQYQTNESAEQYEKMPNLCLKPWAWPTLRYDGTLLVCECDHGMQYSLGNVFRTASFREVWRSLAAQEIRSRFSPDGTIDMDYCCQCRFKIDDITREVVDFRQKNLKATEVNNFLNVEIKY